MQLRDIALKNLERRKSKMLFLAFGIVFGVATVVSLFTLTNSMQSSVNRKVQEDGLKFAVVPKSESASFSVGGIPIVSEVSFNKKPLSANTIKQIKKIPDIQQVKVIAPKVMGVTTIGDKKVLLVGVDFPSELKIKSWWEIKGAKPTGNNQALVGAKVAENLKVQPGQTINTNGTELQITGVLQETGEDEDGIIFVNLNTARDILKKPDTFSFVELITVKDKTVEANIPTELGKLIPDARVTLVKEAGEARQELVDKFGTFSWIVSLIMVLITALIIFTTMSGSVNERTREIGVLRAMGFRESHVKKIILTEASLISGFSGLVGYLLGMGLTYLIVPLYAGFKLVVHWNLLLGLAIILGSILLGVLSSYFPATKAAKMDPVEALRFI